METWKYTIMRNFIILYLYPFSKILHPPGLRARYASGHSPPDKRKFLFSFSSHKRLFTSNLVYFCECLELQRSVKTFNVKLTQKTLLSTKFRLLQQPYLIRRKHLYPTNLLSKH